MPSTDINFRITKADNGWVVTTFNVNMRAVDSFVVKDDEDLAGMIAAALVSQRIGSREEFNEPDYRNQTIAAGYPNTYISPYTGATVGITGTAVVGAGALTATNGLVANQTVASGAIAPIKASSVLKRVLGGK